MKIVKIPSPILYQKCATVTRFDASLLNLLKKMSHTLKIQKNPICVGLAANQVGVDSALFIMRPSLKHPITYHINPKILEMKFDGPSEKRPDGLKFEGCMSIPKIWGKLSRPDKVKLLWQDETGAKHTKVFTGFAAQIVAHEVDHLDGKLFTQRIMEQKTPLFEEDAQGNLVPMKLF